MTTAREFRQDPVTGRWVIVAIDRRARPNDFWIESPRAVGREHCPFCEGHEAMTPPEVLARRADGSAPNTPGWRVRVVPNQFPALAIEGGLEPAGELAEVLLRLGDGRVQVAPGPGFLAPLDQGIGRMIVDGFEILRLNPIPLDARIGIETGRNIPHQILDAVLIKLRGEAVGSDRFGNEYFQEKVARRGMRRRRWVLYNGEPEASKVPPEWYGWLRHTNDAPLPEGGYDVITLWDVIEHLPDPALDIRAIHAALRPGGIFAVSTMDVESKPAM